ncbi:MAG: hypothetical protein R3B06_30350 [Kofleriaceae bacterium]
MPPSRFSISSVLLSYFLVAGGIALGLLLFVTLKLAGQVGLYGVLAVGGAIGGAIAARASRGSTVIEPAIGSLLVIATLVAVLLGTGVGELLWHVASDEIIRLVVLSAGAAAVGAIAGAVVVERAVPGHSDSPVAWLVYIAVATLGASVVGLVVMGGAIARGQSGDGALAGMFFGAMGAGALITGLAAGVAAPRRLLMMSLAGAAAGVMGFFLMLRGLPSNGGDDGEAAAGFAVMGVGCGLLAMVGNLLAWSLYGRRRAAARSAAGVFE